MCSARPRKLTPEAVAGLWERIKAQEKAERAADRAADPDGVGALAGVPATLPALTRALKLQAKASKVGFDWNDPLAVLNKIREEADEIEAEIAAGSRAKAGAEVGDLLFAVVNLARHVEADPEAVLRATNLKFEQRFASIERALAATRQIARSRLRWPRWMRCGTRPRPRKRPDRSPEQPLHDGLRSAGSRAANLARTAPALTGSTRTVTANRPSGPKSLLSTSALR